VKVFTVLIALNWEGLRSDLKESYVLFPDLSVNVPVSVGVQCEVYADIGEVITGQKEALWQQTTVFKSVGTSDKCFIIYCRCFCKVMARIVIADSAHSSIDIRVSTVLEIA